jgi:acyl dehydratase
MLSRHLTRQTPVIGALLKTAVRAARKKPGAATPELPGAVRTGTVPPRPRSLVDDYVRWSGGAPAAYGKTVPAHLFPQWGFPLLAEVLTDIPYDMVKVINAGCRIEIKQPLPAGEALDLRAWLQAIDDDGRRAILESRLVTGTASAPEAIVATMYAHVPSGKPAEKDGKKKEKPRVPETARAIGRRKLGAGAGLEFGLLTGDFNPVHWVRPYAQAAGFKSTILQGFGTLAIAVETLNRAVFAGDPSKLRTIDVRFTRPLVLPASVGVFVDGGDSPTVYVGDAPGGPAYLTGAFNHG